MYRIVSIIVFLILIGSLFTLAIIDIKVSNELVEQKLNIKPIEVNS